MWRVLRLDGKCSCYTKNPQVDQMEVLAAPLPNAPSGVGTRESGPKRPREQGTENQAPESSQTAGLTHLQLQWTRA